MTRAWYFAWHWHGVSGLQRTPIYCRQPDIIFAPFIRETERRKHDKMPHSVWHTVQVLRLTRTIYRYPTSFLHQRHSHLKWWNFVRRTFTTSLRTSAYDGPSAGTTLDYGQANNAAFITFLIQQMGRWLRLQSIIRIPIRGSHYSINKHQSQCYAAIQPLETLASTLYLLELDTLESMSPGAIATIWHCILRAHPAPDQMCLLP